MDKTANPAILTISTRRRWGSSDALQHMQKRIPLGASTRSERLKVAELHDLIRASPVLLSGSEKALNEKTAT
jgi:hypothetical protein